MFMRYSVLTSAKYVYDIFIKYIERVSVGWSGSVWLVAKKKKFEIVLKVSILEQCWFIKVHDNVK